MKVALCIAGQLRSVAKAFTYVEKNLLAHHDVDVFLNFWNTDKHHLVAQAINLYAPKKWSSQDEFHSSYFDQYTRIAHPNWPARNCYHQAYSVFHANLLKKHQELINGSRYDYVVRTRFDFALNRTLPLSEVKEDTVYIPDDNTRPTNDYGHDGFAFGSSEVMDRYSMTYMNIDLLYHKMGCLMNNEEIFSGNLKLNGLVGDKLVYVNMNNPFPPDKYGSMWHSFVRDDFAEWNPLRA